MGAPLFESISFEENGALTEWSIERAIEAAETFIII